MGLFDSRSSSSSSPVAATNVRHEVLAGAFAGAVARLLTAPFDVLKIRFQLQSPTEKKYLNVWQSLRSIVREEGGFISTILSLEWLHLFYYSYYLFLFLLMMVCTS